MTQEEANEFCECILQYMTQFIASSARDEAKLATLFYLFSTTQLSVLTLLCGSSTDPQVTQILSTFANSQKLSQNFVDSIASNAGKEAEVKLLAEAVNKAFENLKPNQKATTPDMH